MALLTVQKHPAYGEPLQVTFVAADVAGDTFAATGNEVVEVVQDGTATGTVVIESQPNPESGRDVDVTIPNVATSTHKCGFLLSRNFVDPATSLISISYPGGITGITIAITRPRN